MAITNGYTTLAVVKDVLGISDTGHDTELERVVEAVSRWIDGFCGRHFYSASETRYYTAEWGDWLIVDDLLTVTTLKTDENEDRTYERTWASTDYDLEPFNAATDGRPYTSIRTAPAGLYTFPTGRKAVQIVGSFGWSAIPDAIEEACILQTTRIFRRKDAPFGVTGSADMGQVLAIARLDPDVRSLLNVGGLVRDWMAG